MSFISWIDLSLSLRLIVSLVLAGIIGYQREKHSEKVAGLRTHILVSLGSTLITLISIYAFSGTNVDPSRIAAGIVTGIGFLGAGTIIRSVDKSGTVIIGLTTAASLWVTAAIGMAIGVGFYFAAVITTVLAYFTLEILRRAEIRKIKK